jgi:hypothetical protein
VPIHVENTTIKSFDLGGGGVPVLGDHSKVAVSHYNKNIRKIIIINNDGGVTTTTPSSSSLVTNTYYHNKTDLYKTITIRCILLILIMEIAL